MNNDFFLSPVNVIGGFLELPFCEVQFDYNQDWLVCESFAFAPRCDVPQVEFEDSGWDIDINGYVMNIADSMYDRYSHAGRSFALAMENMTSFFDDIDNMIPNNSITDGSITDEEIEHLDSFGSNMLVRYHGPGRDRFIAHYSSEPYIQSGICTEIFQRMKTSGRLPDQDYVVRIVEDVLITIHHVVRARNKVDYMLAFATFLKFRLDGPMLSNDNLNLIKNYFDKIFFKEEIQSGETMAKLRSYISKYEEIKNSAIFKKLYRFMMYLLSFSVLNKVGITFNSLNYNKMEEEAIRLKFNSRLDFAACMVDTLTFICERGQQCYLTGSLDPIFHSEKSYIKWFDMCLKLKRDAQFLGDPEPHNIDPFAFEADLNDAIDQGRAIYKHALAIGDLEKNLIGRTLNDLQLIRMNFATKRNAQKKRRAPFAVLIYGGSGVAKSKFVEVNFFHYGKLFKLDTADEFMFTRIPTDPNWSGFATWKWCGLIDDIGFMHPNKAPNGDPTCMELIQVINNVAFTPPQAALEDKGRTPVRFKFVMGTSNARHMNCPAYFSSPLAAQRRLPFVINLEPKPEYTRDGCMIDSSLLPEIEDGDYPDFWYITVHRVIPSGTEIRNQQAAYELIRKFENIYDYLKWFSIEAEKHENIQIKAEKCSNSMAAITLCDICHLPHMRCDCTTCVECQQKPCTCDEESHIMGSAKQEDDVSLPSLVPTDSSCGTIYVSNSDNLDKLSYETPSISIAPDSINSLDDLSDAMSTIAEDDLELQTCYVIRTRNGEQYATPIRDNAVFVADGDNYILNEDDIHEVKRKHEAEAVEMYETANIILDNDKEIAYKNGFVDYIWMHMIGAFITLYLDVTYFRSSIDWLYSWPVVRRALEKIVNTTLSDSRILRDIMRKLGVKVSKKIGNLRICAIVLTVISAGAGIIWLINKCINQYQTDDESEELIEVRTTNIGTAPRPLGKERQNVWHNDNLELSPIDVTPQSTSMKGLPISTFINKILENCVHIRMRMLENGNNYKINKALCLGGRLYVTNLHALPNRDTFETYVISGKVGFGVNSNSYTVLDKNEMFFIPERDLAFFMLSNVNAKRKIVDYFGSDELNGIFNGFYISRNKHGDKFERILKNIHLEMKTTVLGTLPTWMGISNEPTAYGDCGATMIAETKRGPVILGLHYLGDTMGSIGSIRINRTDVLKAMQFFPTMIQNGFVKLEMPSMKRGLVALHDKCTARYLDTGTMHVYGSITGSRTKPRSSVMRTALNELLTKHGYETKYTAPDMTWKPWHLALKDMTQPAGMFIPSILNECVKSYVDDIQDGLDPGEIELLHVYDDMTAINGRPGIAYVDKINRNTSTGFPWNTCKRKFLMPIEQFEDIVDPVELTDEMMDEVEHVIDCYKQGMRYNPVFSASLKDEAVSFAKRADGKTRVFTGSPLPWGIVVRKYFLALVRCLQRNKILFESMPGMKCQSNEWKEFYEFITKFGTDRMIAGDYRKFDKKMCAAIILAAFEILISIAIFSGNYTEEDILVMRGIAEDTAYAYVNFNGDLFSFFGSNPSGHPLTVIINCLANCLYLRYAYYNLNPLKECRSFKQNVANGTYGDDDVMGVSRAIAWYTHTTISEFLKSIGIDFTMADKTSASIPFIDISEVSFLKRSWRWDGDLNTYLCPLDHDSIEKMLMVCVESKSITLEQQTLQSAETALREYFFYGKEVFTDKRKLLTSVIKEANLDYLMMRKLPTWDDLASEWN